MTYPEKFFFPVVRSDGHAGYARTGELCQSVVNVLESIPYRSFVPLFQSTLTRKGIDPEQLGDASK